MIDLPDIPHAIVEPAAEGFVAKPLADTPEAHAAFQQAMLKFSRSQTEWGMVRSKAGRYEAWTEVVFARAG
jgi:hypothetical protein